MRNNFIVITMAFILILGTGLTACSSKARVTLTPTTNIQPSHTPTVAVQPTDTQSPTIPPTYTQLPTVPPTSTPSATIEPEDPQTPTVQLTNTLAPTIPPTDTQTPTVAPTDTLAPASTATSLPAVADGASLLKERCTVCHTLARVASKQLTADKWQSIVNRMIQHGARLTTAEQRVLVDYLARTYGP